MYTKKKNSILFAFLLCLINPVLTRTDEQNKYAISGSLPDSIDNVYVYLTQIKLSGNLYFKYSTIVLKEDSAIVHRGRFSFTCISENEKKIYTIWSTQHPFINGWVVIEPGTISYSYKDYDYKGYAYSKGTVLNNYLTYSIVTHSMQMAQLGEMIMNRSIDIKNIHSFVLKIINNSLREYFFLLFSSVFSENDMSKIMSKLSENAQNTYNEIFKRSSVPSISACHPFIPFRWKTIDNKYITLVDVVKKNKIFLVDFWVSCCAPCIREMSVLTQLYNDYQIKGLEIIGVSLYDRKSFWQASIKQHNMSWIQISIKDESNNIAELYGVVSIPHTILINGNGEIIATQIRVQELIETIKNELE